MDRSWRDPDHEAHARDARDGPGGGPRGSRAGPGRKDAVLTSARRFALIALLALAAACAGTSEPRSAKPGPARPVPEPFFPVERAREDPLVWRYRVTTPDGMRTVRLTGWYFERRAHPGTDDLADAWNQYVYEPRVPAGPADKAIWFVRPRGIELRYHGVLPGDRDYDPPILVLPTIPDDRPRWTWEGRLDGRPSRATCRLVGAERVDLPDGPREALHFREEHAGRDLVVERWFCRGIGLVRLEQRTDGARTLSMELVSFGGSS